MEDKLYCLLSVCESCKTFEDIVYGMYLYQLSGVPLGYHYRITSSGLQSRDLARDINDFVAQGYVIYSGDGYAINVNVSFDMTHDFYIKSNEMETFLSEIESELLKLVCVSDYVVTTFKDKENPETLLSRREMVEDTVSKLCRGYTPKKFKEAMGMVNYIKGGMR